jgi:alcohol dehydrogenase (cytochrome c)
MLKIGLWVRRLGAACSLSSLMALQVAGATSPSATATNVGASATDIAGADWPYYNRALQGERFSPLAKINTGNVTQLHQLCEYDTGAQTSFETGLIKVDGLLYGTTDTDTFAVNPSNCRQAWRAHEVFTASSPLKVNRGVAVFKGRVFRGLLDGQVVAYDALHGKRLWATRIGDPGVPQSVTAAPVAWEDLVFVSNANGDLRGIRGVIVALSARDGRVIWQQSLVPAQQGEPKASGWGNAGNISGGASWTSYSLDAELGLLYVPVANPSPDFNVSFRPGNNQFTNSVLVLEARSGRIVSDIPITPADFRDYDTSTAPALFTSKAGNRLLAVAAKDGVLHVFDRSTLEKQFEVPVTEIQNRNVPLGLNDTVHYCPG